MDNFTEFSFEDRLVDSENLSYEDECTDNELRPKTLDEYVGQEKVKENLKVFLESAKLRKEPLDHVLLYGPPGLGKTTLAGIIANELGSDIVNTSGPAIEKPGNLQAFLIKLQEQDVLFIDEIHRMNRTVEEILYPAMEDYSVDLVDGKGQLAEPIHFNLNRFTLVGATTRAGSLSSPLRDRFGIILRLEMYTDEELTRIIKRSAGILNINIDGDAALEIATRSRKTPRIANRLLKRVRDFSLVKGEDSITLETANEALFKMDIDKLGLDQNDRRMLKVMIDNYGGGPVGLETLSAALGEESVTLEDVYEPYLMQIGFLQRTPRGRCVTLKAFEHLGIEPPKNSYINQISLFTNSEE